MDLVMADSLVHGWTAPRPRGRLPALLRLPALWIARASRRKELMSLDAAQMRDCGLDPMAVQREATKPFWRD
jgi:uncharacterized protein YjiS (DUF1127 family)